MSDIEKLFSSIDSEILTEDVKLQIATIFENVVTEVLEKKEKELEEQYQVKFEKEKEELVEQLDEYIDYFINEYINEKEEIVEDFTKVKLAEKVLSNFLQMCEAFNISLSDSSIELQENIESIEKENKELYEKVISLKRENRELQRKQKISEALTKLETEMERHKFLELIESIEFNEENFDKKIAVFINNIKKNALSENSYLDGKLQEKVQDSDSEETSVISENIKSYLKFLK